MPLFLGWLSEARKVKEFEAALAWHPGLANPFALKSGTSALHLALVLADVEPGNEVIVLQQTFVTSGLVVLQQFAKPVFAAIDTTTGNIDPKAISTRITSRTKAIMPLPWGNCCERFCSRAHTADR